jgi:hypothetical protein
MLTWLVWIFFWLSVALVPLELLFAWQVPPFTRYDKVPAELGWAAFFGMMVILLRFLLQVPPVLMIGFRPVGAGASLAVWLILTVVVYVAIEAGMAFLYYLWMDRATDTTHGATDRAVWILGPLYLAALIAESGAIYWLLRSGSDGQ